MFLNNLAEPVDVQYYSKEGSFPDENLNKSSPLLLSSTNPTVLAQIPCTWSGCIYSTNRIIQECKADLNKLKESSQIAIKELNENEPVSVCLSDNSQVNIIAIPVKKAQRGNKVIFIVQDNYICRLCVDTISDDFSSFVLNAKLRNVITNCVDLLYVNDAAYLNSSQKSANPKIHPTDFQLRSLVLLVRPKAVVGLHQAKLPEYIMSSCIQPNINEDVLDYIY